MQLYKDDSTTLEPLAGRKIAVLGYGNQGRAQALNLRDNGLAVIVGNRDDAYHARAVEDGFETLTIAAAAAAADVLLILTTDESQPIIWDEQIAPGLEPDDILVWASGYNIGYGLIVPPADTDVVMVAPRMTGNMVRELFQRGSGALAQFGVHQDASGQARDRVLALSKGIGCTRGGVFESTFREEAELDLFAEQVVWPVLTAWMKASFEMGVEFGFSPELMVMELYASGETAEIMAAMARNGFFRQMTHHSTTSQYGTLSRGAELVTEEMKKKARDLFTRDVRGGAFVAEWQHEQATGSKQLQALREQALDHLMSRTETAVIEAVQAVHSRPTED